MKNEIITIFSDGGARGNPGPSAIGVVLHLPKDTVELSQYIGSGTNNQAEYQAVIAGLKKLQELNFTNQEVNWFLDSELVVKQLNGEYKIKDKILQEKVKIIQDLISKMNLKINFMHITRDKNKQADKLANQALDQHKSRGAYTFIEILISSLIFVSVIIVATAGFGQIVKYRAIVNANLDVNQVARTLSDQITSDIKNADAEIKVTYSGALEPGNWTPGEGALITKSVKTIVLVEDNSLDKLFRICDETNSTKINGCITKIGFSSFFNSPPIDMFIVLAKKQENQNIKVKIYHIKNKNTKDSGFGVKYLEIDYANSPLDREIINIENNLDEYIDFIPQSKAFVSLLATEYTGDTTPSRFDLDFFITTPNYFSLTAKDYEKAWLTLHTVASVRDFK